MKTTHVSIVCASAALVVAGFAAYIDAQASSPPSSRVGMWKQVGYFKASRPGEGDELGHSTALSADGTTLAVGAKNERSAATGINGNQADNSAFSAGAVFVYARNGNRWAQQGYVKASNSGADDQFGFAIALSADGNTLAVSAPFEDSAAAGVNGNQADNSVENSGAVYIFTRTGTSWSQQAYIKASNTGEKDEGDQFGYSISLSGDGNTLAVGVIGEDSSATGINGDQSDNKANGSGAAYVFTRTGGAWSQQAYVKSSMTRPNVLFGYSIGLSGNGDTLAVAEYDADRGKGALHVLTRTGGTWSHQARLQASNAENGDSLGYSLAISEDGNTIAAGAADEDCMTPGVNPPGCDKDQPQDNSSGAAYVFVRSGTTWTQQAFIKASNPGKEDWFGVHIALSGDGNTLAVCAPNEDSAAKGINGKQDDDSADGAGAVYVFIRTGTTWAQHAYLKGANTEQFDEIGSSAAFTRDGRMIAVGAHFESSGAQGFNGNQADNSVPRSGAVYVFTR